ncbi:hypothetical protein [Paludibaculum fermentans]|uniref:Leucine-rich repeat domain-containing protein n=1 Tax=Paludibaculum fermentans TaxID=1473598 RepID=A0A7S7SJ75_PALFE|nr:hypothetical protein [Paludibaculum fermentans]QOY86919.1 hypothetical protein IRI77_29710 [Paludibaculum fermentans]
MAKTDIYAKYRATGQQLQNLRTIDLGGGRAALWMDSDCLEACVDYFIRNKLYGIAISPLDGFKLSDLGFLTRCVPAVEHLVVLHVDMIDVSALNDLRLLRSLHMTGRPKQKLDIANLDALHELDVQWWPKLRFDGRLPKLRVLKLKGYRSNVNGALDLPALQELEDLELIQTPIPSLAGIDRFPGLRRLACYYLPKLRHIAPVGHSFCDRDLTTLEFGHCPHITDNDSVSSIRSLRTLWFNHCGKVPSLRFLDALPELQNFRFVGTEVLDGDLAPCLRIPSVGFSDKKTYSHRYADFEARSSRA